MQKVNGVKDMISLLERERAEQRKTKRQLCLEAGMSSMTFNNLIARGTGGTFKSVLAFCNALGLEIVIQRKQ
jgi:DNA-binding phage protein